MVNEIALKLAGDNTALVPLYEVGLSVAIVASAFLPMISLVAMFSIWWEQEPARPGHASHCPPLARRPPMNPHPFGSRTWCSESSTS